MSPQHETNRSAFTYYRRLRKLKTHLESHVSERLPLEDAARIVGLEKKYFSVFFYEKVGIRYRDWHAQIRVDKAKELMTEANYPVTRVAFAVGFRDLRTFERAFKKHTGTTPVDFKKSVRPDRTTIQEELNHRESHED